MPDTEVLTNLNDPFFANVKLLLVFDGAQDSAVFRDYSAANKLPSLNWNVVITTEEKKFRTGSGTFKLKDLNSFGDSGDGGE